MSVKYGFEIENRNSSVDITSMIEMYCGEYYTDQDRSSLMLVTDKVKIPAVHAHEFEELLKKLEDVSYEIVGVFDVPVDEEGYVIDSEHPEFREHEWISVEE